MKPLTELHSKGVLRVTNIVFDVFVTFSHFLPSLIFVSTVGAYSSGATHGTPL